MRIGCLVNMKYTFGAVSSKEPLRSGVPGWQRSEQASLAPSAFRSIVQVRAFTLSLKNGGQGPVEQMVGVDQVVSALTHDEVGDFGHPLPRFAVGGEVPLACPPVTASTIRLEDFVQHRYAPFSALAIVNIAL